MDTSRPNAFLKVVSILFIVVGVFSLLSAAAMLFLGVGSIMSGALSDAEAAGLSIMFNVMGVLMLINGILDFVIGIGGMKGNYGVAKVLVYITIVLDVIGIVVLIAQGGDLSGCLISLCGMILPVAWIIGMKMSEKQTVA